MWLYVSWIEPCYKEVVSRSILVQTMRLKSRKIPLRADWGLSASCCTRCANSDLLCVYMTAFEWTLPLQTAKPHSQPWVGLVVNEAKTRLFPTSSERKKITTNKPMYKQPSWLWWKEYSVWFSPEHVVRFHTDWLWYWCPISTRSPCSVTLRSYQSVEDAPKVGVGPMEGNDHVVWFWPLIDLLIDSGSCPWFLFEPALKDEDR